MAKETVLMDMLFTVKHHRKISHTGNQWKVLYGGWEAMEGGELSADS